MLPSGGRVPQADRPEVIHRRHGAPVRPKGHGPNLMPVPGEAAAFLPGRDVPNSDAAVVHAPRGPLPIGGKGHAVHAPCRTLEAESPVTFDGPIGPGPEEFASVRSEGEG